MSQTPTSIVGAPDDADVERALTFVLENSQRFDPGARLDSLDVLRTQRRRSRCAPRAVRRGRADRNPGVRMKALETLQGFEQDAAVRQTLLDALQSDGNSGVRVEAINLLVNSLRAGRRIRPGGPANSQRAARSPAERSQQLRSPAKRGRAARTGRRRTS